MPEEEDFVVEVIQNKIKKSGLIPRNCLEKIGDSFEGQQSSALNYPSQWHQTIKVHNPHTKRVKQFFKCNFDGCNSVFRKSCNLRDHFRKHTH